MPVDSTHEMASESFLIYRVVFQSFTHLNRSRIETRLAVAAVSSSNRVDQPLVLSSA